MLTPEQSAKSIRELEDYSYDSTSAKAVYFDSSDVFTPFGTPNS